MSNFRYLAVALMYSASLILPVAYPVAAQLRVDTSIQRPTTQTECDPLDIFCTIGEMTAGNDSTNVNDSSQSACQQISENLKPLLLLSGSPELQIVVAFISGNVCQFEGDNDGAIENYERALNITKQLEKSKADAASGLILNNIGTAYLYKTEYDKAFVYCQQALKLLEPLKDNTELSGSVKANLGLIETYRGNFDEADRYFEAAKVDLAEAKDKTPVIINLNNQGMKFQLDGDRSASSRLPSEIASRFISATANYDEALNILDEYGVKSAMFGTIDSKTAALISQMLSMLAQSGSAPPQVKLLGEILQGRNPMLEAAIRYNRAIARFQLASMSQPASADLFSQVTEELEAVQQIAHTYGNTGLEGIAAVATTFVYVTQKDYAQARQYCDDLFQILNAQIQPDATGTAHFVCGLSAEAEGRVARVGKDTKAADAFEAEAMRHYTTAISLTQQALIQVGADNTIANLTNLFSYTPPYQRLAALFAAKGDMRNALQAIEAGRATLTRIQLRAGSIDFSSNADAADLSEEQKLAQDLSVARKYRAMVSAGEDSPEAKQVQQAEIAYQRQRNLMQDKTKSILAREVAGYTTNLEEVQKRLDKDTTLLVYKIGAGNPTNDPAFNSNSFVMAMTREGKPQVIWLKDTDEKTIGELSAKSEWSQPIKAPNTFTATETTRVTQRLQRLYQLLFAPVASQVKTRRVIIVPDASLLYLPFAAFEDSIGSYLIDKYAISMSPSVTTWMMLQDRTATKTNAKKTALVVSNANAPSYAKLPSLQMADTEVSDVAAQLKLQGYTVITGTDESETALRSTLSAASPRVLYISAHAKVESTSTLLLSSPIFLKAEGDALSENGELNVSEVYELNLSNTDIVILSACQTAQGGRNDDYGLFNRAFLASGANRVVSTLWTVNELPTVELMTRFVSLRKDNKNYSNADALQAAMLEIKKKYPSPFYWAAFTLHGLQ